MIKPDPLLLRAWFEQTRVAIQRSSGRAALARWMQTNTRDPFKPVNPWSFKKHEYQIGILESNTPHTSVRKAAQTGVSELTVRAVLGLLSLFPGTNWIYVLPSLMFARKFSVSRIDPVIENSPFLYTSVSKEVNSSEIKRIGSSFLFVAGAQKQSQAISIPAKGLVRDEHDFCDPQVLTTFESRLAHNEPNEEVILDFSTPTLPGYGISKLFDAGDGRVYMAWHEKCGQWVEVNPSTSIVIPGFQDSLFMLQKEDLNDPRIKVKDSWVKCPHCGGEISLQNLSTPEYRAWVPARDNRDSASFYVSPLDVPSVNPPSKIVWKILSYESSSDWINFGLGMPYESAENSVSTERLDKAFCLPPVYPREGAAAGTAMGVDVGKISHMLIGKRVDGKLHLIWGERIRQDEENTLRDTYLERQAQYGVVRGVIDAAPDLTVPKQVIARSHTSQAWAAYFVQGSGPASLGLFTQDFLDQVVKIYRTRTMDAFVKEFNAGRVLLPAGHPDEQIIKKQFKAMKRIKRLTAEGNEKAVWVSDGDDHYFLAATYLFAAQRMMEDGLNVIPISAFSGKGVIGKVRMKLPGEEGQERTFKPL